MSYGFPFQRLRTGAPLFVHFAGIRHIYKKFRADIQGQTNRFQVIRIQRPLSVQNSVEGRFWNPRLFCYRDLLIAHFIYVRPNFFINSHRQHLELQKILIRIYISTVIL